LGNSVQRKVLAMASEKESEMASGRALETAWEKGSETGRPE
jgi:hypothetical protein